MDQVGGSTYGSDAEKKKKRRKETARLWYERNKQLTIDRAKKWKKDNPEKLLKSQQKARETNPDKIIARRRINHLIEAGKIPSPKTLECADCGCNALEYHHEDYTKPLEVVALCKTCHTIRHRVDSLVQHPTD